MTALPKAEPTLISPAEYLAKERVAEHKSEYLDGEVFAMAGGSWAHNTLISTISYLLFGQLTGSPCGVVGQDQRVRTPDDSLYTYPDVLIACNPEFADDDSDTILNPIVIFEVLSPSTAKFDRFTKFNRYRGIPSLRDYVLVDQSQMLVEHRSKLQGSIEGHWWGRYLESPEDELILDSVNCRLRLSDIYQRIDFASPPANE